MSSDTPRTDALVKTVNGWQRLALVSGELAELARELERENNQLRAQLAELQEKLNDMNEGALDE